MNVTPIAQEDLFHLSAKTIVINPDNKVLILWCAKKDGGYWDLPGGRVNVQEKLEDAAVRELFEETGIALKDKPELLGIVPALYRLTLKDSSNVGLLYAFFKAKAACNTVALSFEHDSFHWVSVQEALEKVGYMGVVPFMQKFKE